MPNMLHCEKPSASSKSMSVACKQLQKLFHFPCISEKVSTAVTTMKQQKTCVLNARDKLQFDNVFALAILKLIKYKQMNFAFAMQNSLLGLSPNWKKHTASDNVNMLLRLKVKKHQRAYAQHFTCGRPSITIIEQKRHAYSGLTAKCPHHVRVNAFRVRKATLLSPVVVEMRKVMLIVLCQKLAA